MITFSSIVPSICHPFIFINMSFCLAKWPRPPNILFRSLKTVTKNRETMDSGSTVLPISVVLCSVHTQSQNRLCCQVGSYTHELCFGLHVAFNLFYFIAEIKECNIWRWHIYYFKILLLQHEYFVTIYLGLMYVSI